MHKHTLKLKPMYKTGFKESSKERHKNKMITIPRFNEKDQFKYSERSNRKVKINKTQSVKQMASNF